MKHVICWYTGRHLRKWRRRWVVIQNNKIYTFANKRKYQTPTEIIDLREFSRLSTDELKSKNNNSNNANNKMGSNKNNLIGYDESSELYLIILSNENKIVHFYFIHTI